MNWNSLVRRRRWERRMDAEMQFHLESQIADHVAQGLSREQAEMRARREFGALELAKDECRDERPAECLTHLSRDVRYGLRTLRKNPAFTMAAILTIALGVGANSAIFSVVYAALLKPLPYADSDRIYGVDVVIPERRSQVASVPVPVQVYLAWRSAPTSFSAIAALRPWECSLGGDGSEPERLGGARVSTNFFSFLGVAPTRGRAFLSEEEQPGKEKVVVISDALWRRRYGSDPAAVGRTIDINGEAHRIVGIASPSLLVPTGTAMNSVLAFAQRIDLWKPIAPTARELGGESWDHGVLVRLKPGEDADRGREQLQAILNRFYREHVPGFKSEFLTRIVPVRDIYVEGVRLRLLLVLAASAILLLTACVNFANLLLARAANRAGEFATRIALGASRSRIFSQAVTETTLLALLGGAVGAASAALSTVVIASHGPAQLHPFASAPIHSAVFLFALAISVLTGLACGLIAARQAYGNEAADNLREAARSAPAGARALRFRQVLVGVEIALGTALVASAGLLLHSFANVMRADRGYQVERVLAVDLSLFGKRYDSGESRTAFYRQLCENVAAIPGVLAAGTISDLPASTGPSGPSQAIFLPDDTDFARSVLARPVGMIRSVTPGYFAASGTRLRAGRFFNSREPALAAIISESLARSLWPQDKPEAVIGRAIRQGNVNRPLIAIAGVVDDVRHGAADRTPQPIIYRPHEQWASGPASVVVRTAQDPSSVAPAVRASIRQMDATLPIPPIRTMSEIVSDAVAERRFQMLLTSLFALVALLLGSVGVYGVVNYSVACRTRDIGLRIALGAMKADVLRWVFTSGMKPVIIGLAAGATAAVGIAGLLRSQLFGVAPHDPLSLGAVVLILLFAPGLACYIPARRAARMDPTIALRHE
jgi:predicted permease